MQGCGCKLHRVGLLRLTLFLPVLWLLTLAAASGAHAQAGAYPDRPVTIISDAAAGSTPDVDARFVAEGLSKL